MRIKVPGASKKVLQKVLQKAKKHTSFFTHDNGGRPIAVRLYPKKNLVKVFFRKYNDNKEKYITNRKPAFIFNRVFEVFVGYGLFEKDYPKFLPKTVGNAFGLVRESLDGTKLFTYVGISVESIKLKKNEKVIRYQSIVGNNDVPYGFLWTSRGVYTLASNNCRNAFIPNRKLVKTLGSLRKIPLKFDPFLRIDLWCSEKGEKAIEPLVHFGRVEDLV